MADAPNNPTQQPPPRGTALMVAGAVAVLACAAGSAALSLLTGPKTVPANGLPVQPSSVAFHLLAGLTIASAAGVAFSKNIIYSSFSLLGAFLGVAGLYIYLSADFLAVTQVLIYVGGVLVLILFAVMLTSRIQDIRLSNQSLSLVPAALLTLVTAGAVSAIALQARWHAPGEGVARSTAADLGDLFLGKYLLPFEIASVLLLAALVGAVVIARKDMKADER